MDNRAEIREFLMSRRARISPAEAGLPPAGRRRVPGLRRVEVAMLAGVSVEYYSRLERGDAAGVSEGILDAVAGALRLDDAERRHLLDLVRTSGATRAPRRRTPVPVVRSTVQHVLDAITGAPAVVHDGRLNHLAGNALGRALFSPFLAMGDEPPNSARFTFLDPGAPDFLRDWDKAADDTVAILRAEAGRDPYDRNLSDLVGELSTRSEEFRTRWASHDVRLHATGTKRLHHPVVGDLDLSYESFPAPDHGQTLLIYVAEPGTPSYDALRVLASYAATDQHSAARDSTATSRSPNGLWAGAPASDTVE
ncbi:helix-turn-helix transcriptional regulator [Nocardioides sp. Soil777]|uniref:helix-turn-helix transcriptional regulator n=1 Tax=Nocardioides sp. Soil777 TaxID=1736409 RepID=UPI0009EC3EFC|nr:helix-turn-helix transcriptional regulator [Nocardioides sp. Soil777]